MELDGKTVLLTGATGGLGRAIAEALAGTGRSLVLSSRKADELERSPSSLPGGGHRVEVADLAEEGEAPPRCSPAAGDVDVLVANAALPASGHLDSFSQERDRPRRCASTSRRRSAWRGSWSRRDARAARATSSSSPRCPARSRPRARPLYCATKFGLRGFALSLREDLRGPGVGVSVVMPGMIRDAGMFADCATPPPRRSRARRRPAEVGARGRRAIERDRAEVAVAPLRTRVLSAIGANAPELAGRVAGSTATKVADRIAAGQADKR